MTIVTLGRPNGLMNVPGNTNGVDASATKTVYLITGASRGVGKGLVAAFLLRPDSVVVAGVRNPASQKAALQELPKSDNSELIVVKLDCASETDAADAVEELRTQHGIAHLDVVVANAAIAENYGPASTLRVEHLHNHMKTNTYSVLSLFQASRPLLELARPGNAKFVLIGAPISTITEMESCARAPLSAYGVTKLAASYLVRKFHFENKWLVAFIIDPGHVQTDMGAQGARLMGRKEAPVTIDDSVNGICARIDEATKEESSGHFLLFEDGRKLPW
ncbi:putative Norsolorinic acid ketoreductase nor1 [Seiridium cardinale]|uniref:Norsolorinic acid ketoreductase nor1 n=1 Tax=Seiridium cardinale TaxID=138064 RepID=A0ABR2Y593_9PEZI